MKPHVLLVDEDDAFLEMLRDGLVAGFDVELASSAEEAIDLVELRPFDVVVTDNRLRGLSGIDLARNLELTRPDLPVIVIMACAALEDAVQAIRAGAFDFYVKPVDLETLSRALHRATRDRSLDDRVERHRPGARLDEILTGCEAMRSVVGVVARVAPTTTTLLVSGESGTGKELVARAVHRLGGHPEDRFVAVNCAAIPEALIEAELFGCERGAFTGALSSRSGLLAAAGRGTLFLDEVSELSLAVQPKVLRALQERSVRRLGGTREEPIAARIIAATNQPLADAVAAGRFRQDLYYRLAVVEIALPPLRARGNDVLLLARHFLARHAARLKKEAPPLSPEAAERLLSYDWPGNVRELENCLERAVTLSRTPRIELHDLPPAVLAARSPLSPAPELPDPGGDLSALPTLEAVRERYIRQVLDRVAGNKTLAAKVLGVDRRTLQRKIRLP